MHSPTLSARWNSTENIDGTDIPKTVVRQISDLHELGDWSIHHESVPLANGSPTIDHYIVWHNHITVVRVAQDERTSGYYLGAMEAGVIYNPVLAAADVNRLKALDSALPASSPNR